MKILITGATGLIGKKLGKALTERKHEILIVSRSHQAKDKLSFVADVIVGDLSKAPIRDIRLNDVDAVINLAGEPVAEGRWSEDKKKRIYDSRIVGTENLIRSLTQNTKVLVSSSAIGFYGDRADEILQEDSHAGSDFLSKVCVDWEKAADLFLGQKVFIRTGFVLSPHGGALEKMLPAFRLNLGGPLASGKQWMSWIHIDDLVNLYIWSIENVHAKGVYNGASPNPVTNRQFTEVLAKTLRKRMGPSVPFFALKILFGEMAGMLVGSQRASSQKSQAEGFKFQHAFLPEALQSLFNSQT